jgi:hypothetical protein
MQQRRGTASQWTAANTVLSAGEIGFETDTNKFKIGNGSTAWNSLPYFLNRNDIEVGLLDTDEVSEGTTNLYFTAQRAVDAVIDGAVDTDDIEEGTTNLYFTNQRAVDALGENLELDALSDVDTTGVADGDALVYDTATTSWVPGSVAIDSLNDIADVNITDPANGEVLVYSDGDWVNQEASGGGIKDIVTESETIIPAASVWLTQTSNFQTTVNSIAYGNNLWVAGGDSGDLRTSTDAVTWITQNINFAYFDNGFFEEIQNNVYSVAYGNGLWVAAGGISPGTGPNSRITTSTNGITWITQSSNFENVQIRSVAHGNNLWVAGGDEGQLRISTNAITWVTQNSNFGNTRITSIAYGNNIWVASSFGGQIRTSTNAITWVTRTSNFGNTFIYSVAYGDGLWLAGGSQIGTTAAMRTSTDAITWVTQNSNFGGTGIFSISYGNGTWLAAGHFGQIHSSTNTIDWVTRTSNFGFNSINSVAYGNNIFVAGGSVQIRTSSATTQIIPPNQTLSLEDAGDLIQVDSSVQTTITIPSNDSVAIPVKTQVNIVQAGLGTVEIVSEQEVVGTVDGTNFDPALSAATWTSRNSVFAGQNDVAYANNLWVLAGLQLRTSTDAINWVTQTSNFGDTAIKSIAYGNDTWAAVGGGYALPSQLRTSTNAVTWVTRNSNFGNTIASQIVHANNLWLIVGWENSLRTSTDAITWVTQTSNFGNRDILTVAYGDGLWVAGGTAGQLRTSTNAISWVTRTSNFGITNINSIAYGNGVWAAGGYAGQLRTSTNAINWVTRNANLPGSYAFSIRDLDYGDVVWTIGTNAALRTSTDAISWVTRSSNFGGYGQVLNSIGYGNGFWVAVDSSGGIQTSQNVLEQVDVFGDAVTINSSSGLKTRDQWSVATAIKTGEDEWLITGDLSE